MEHTMNIITVLEPFCKSSAKPLIACSLGLSGRCPIMNDHQPRVNAGQNCPIGKGGFHPTPRVGTEKTLVINRLCITRHAREIIPQGRFTNGVTCERVHASGPRYGFLIKSLSLLNPLLTSKI